MDGTQAPEELNLDKLEEYLESDRSPENCMMLSDLDGFLTGIAIGPELILPSEWLPVIWGGEEPAFADSEQANEIISAIMGRYNEILSTLQEGRWRISPIFWEGVDGSLIAGDWAEGFMDAVRMRMDAWEPLFLHRSMGELLMPILVLCCDENGESYFSGDEAADEILIKTAPNVIPAAIDGIDMFWRERALKPSPIRKELKTGRNDPCPCGSGKKYKRCCGVN